MFLFKQLLWRKKIRFEKNDIRKNHPAKKLLFPAFSGFISDFQQLRYIWWGFLNFIETTVESKCILVKVVYDHVK